MKASRGGGRTVCALAKHGNTWCCETPHNTKSRQMGVYLHVHAQCYSRKLIPACSHPSKAPVRACKTRFSKHPSYHLFVSPANAGWFLRVIFSERMTTRQLKIRKVDYTPEPEKWMVWKMLFLFQGCILSFHVNFPGCNVVFCKPVPFYLPLCTLCIARHFL